MRKKKIFIIGVTVILFVHINLIWGDVISGYDILRLGIGGDIGVDTSISLSKNVNSFYNNPALLVDDDGAKGEFYEEKNRVYVGYNRLAIGLNYMSIFSAFKVKYAGKIGVGITGLLLDSYISTDYEGSGYVIENNDISFAGYTFILGWGKRIINKLNIGINMKISDNAPDEGNIGIGLSGGIIYRSKKWGIGLAVNNMGGAVKNFKEDKYPDSIEIGGHYIFYLLKKKFSKVHKVDITDRVSYDIIDRNIINFMGAEYSYNEIIFIRSSLMYNSKKGYRVGIGLGVLYKESIKVDYGFEYDMLGITHRVGIGLIW